MQKKSLYFRFFFCALNAQNSQSDFENLETQYISNAYDKKNELKLLLDLVNTSNNPNITLEYGEILIDKATQVDSLQYLISGNLQKGNAYLRKSDFSKALKSYLVASDLAQKINNEVSLSMTNVAIGDLYSEMGNHDNSIEYYKNSIKVFRDLVNNLNKIIKDNFNNEVKIKTIERYFALALLNSGDEYFNAGKYDKALSHFYESSGLCEKLNLNIASAYNLGNIIGMVYAKQNKPELAEANMNAAIKILEKDYYPISVYLTYISDIYIDLELPEIAKTYIKRSLELAKKYQVKDEISQAYLNLSKIYESDNDIDSSHYHLKEYVKYKYSISKILSESSKMASKFEISKKQDEVNLLKEKQKIEVDLLKQKRKNEKIVMYSFMGGMILVSGLAFGRYRRNRFISKTKKIIDEEKKKSDSLLLNISPRDTAEELKKSGKVEAKKYQSVTVLFTDFKGFTKYAENSPPEKLVESVDMYFSEFDKIMAKYKLDKIKTIGVSYMCAGVLPEQSDNHAELMTQAALDILDFVKKSKQVYGVTDIRFDVRIGVHTGPVLAGVVGKYKFSYDIWGDTVNVASRIESSCESGKISLSEDTYQLVKDKYELESRGQISVKNRSPLDMYYLKVKN